MRKDLSKILCACITALILLHSPVYAESTAGTRVVKVSLPAASKTTNKQVKTTPLTGKAEVSDYTTTGLESTLQEKAAKIWVFGVLGGDREYSVDAPVLFKTDAANISESDTVRFIVLREALYTASSWAIGSARIESLEKGDLGMDVKLYIADIEPLIVKYAEEMVNSLRIEPSTARILAEWKVSSELKDPEKVRTVRYTEIVKKAPINPFGKLAFGPNSIKELLSAPEKEAVKAIFAAKKHKLAFAKSYIEDLTFIVKYSSSLEFSSELKEAINKR